MWLNSEIRTLGDLPRYYAKRQPERLALIGAGRRRSFGQLDQAANRIGRALARDGIPRRSNVGFLARNCIEYFEVMFGVAKADCAVLPLNWRLAAPELAAVMADAEAPLLFVETSLRPLAEQACQCAGLRMDIVEFDPAAPDPLRAWLGDVRHEDPAVPVDPRHTALLIYTSGTTGKPKGVELSHEGASFMRLCEHLEPAYQWQADDIMMFVMPNFHLVGTGLSLQGLYNGVPLTILPTLDVPLVLETIERDRPTICCLVPTAIQMLLDHPAAKGTDFSSLRLVMYAGSSISSTLLRRALVEMKCQFMQFYGATEIGGAATLLRPGQHDIEDEQSLRSCGTPLPLIEFRVVDGAGRDLPEGAIGEFWVRAPSMFRGYWRQPEASAATMCDGWYRTGDAGYRVADGRLFIVDRTKDMIISGGENIYSTEVEQALIKHPSVGQVAVIGLPDERWGEKVVAVVVPLPGKSVSEDELLVHCRGLIAGYKVPKLIRFADALPMTPSGKVLKSNMRRQYAETERSG